MWVLSFLLLIESVKCFHFYNFFSLTHRKFHHKNYFAFSEEYFENYLKRLNSKNSSIRDNAILNNLNGTYRPAQSFEEYKENIKKEHPHLFNQTYVNELSDFERIFGPGSMPGNIKNNQDSPIYEDIPQEERRRRARENPKWLFIMNQPTQQQQPQESENFRIVKDTNITFKDVGGYDNIKEELNQCVDILQNYETYIQFNVRIPKGLIFEGPPGNGKTLLAKAFAGEANTSFIAVAGSEFQEKYVGVGSSRVKELFELAHKNKPCIVFIDEIDAIGRKRSGDGEASTSERDNTLNQLLVQMDGFENSHGIFVIGATNRVDLLDPALVRPGRIDKHMYIGVPDSKTRKSILGIHIKGKPHSADVIIDDLVDLTTGMSAAQIENLLNEAMLYTLRNKRFVFTMDDIELVMNRVTAGWQPNEHQFTEDMIDRITIHEMGHAMIGLLVKQHSKLTKIVINLSSPRTPGYTMFEGSTSTMYTRDSLFEHLMILLAGRIAEEIFYNVSVTTGAINDFEEALKLAEKMVIYYGMGEKLIYPSNSEKFKTEIDEQVLYFIHDAYHMSDYILRHCKPMMAECAEILKKKKVLKRDELFHIIWTKYPELMELYQGESSNN
jgi:cell division protease FtsH